MTILHCIPSLPVGGAERQLSILCAGQIRAGYDVHVAYGRGGGIESDLLRSGATPHVIWSSSNHDPRIFFRLAALIRAVQPHLIQTWLPQMDVFGGMAALATTTPWVLTERSMAAAYTARVKDRLLRPVVGRRANAIVANSRAGLDYWASRARPSTILALVPNAVSFDQVCMVEPTEPLGLIAPGTPFILVAGRLSSEKNLGMLIDALALVSRELNVATIVCGDGPTRPELEAQIAANGLQERVFLVGIRRDVWGLMKQARALVNASVFEGHPNVVIEAAAAGCPLVLSDIAAHRAVLDHGCAAFFDPASPRGLADALLQTLRTPGIAGERATRARDAVAALSVGRAVAGYQHVYDTLISRKR